VALLIWRAPTLARFVKSIRYKDVEVLIRENLESARDEAEKVRGTENHPPAPLYQDDKVLQLARIDPALAVVDIWKQLESRIILLIQHNGLMRFTSPSEFIFELGKQKKLSATELKIFKKLREVRNASVHSQLSPSLTLAEVVEFRDLAELLGRKIDELREQPGNIDLPLKRKP
jgi:hypothetical protein